MGRIIYVKLDPRSAVPPEELSGRCAILLDTSILLRLIEKNHPNLLGLIEGTTSGATLCVCDFVVEEAKLVCARAERARTDPEECPDEDVHLIAHPLWNRRNLKRFLGRANNCVLIETGLAPLHGRRLADELRFFPRPIRRVLEGAIGSDMVDYFSESYFDLGRIEGADRTDASNMGAELRKRGLSAVDASLLAVCASLLARGVDARIATLDSELRRAFMNVRSLCAAGEGRLAWS